MQATARGGGGGESGTGGTRERSEGSSCGL